MTDSWLSTLSESMEKAFIRRSTRLWEYSRIQNENINEEIKLLSQVSTIRLRLATTTYCIIQEFFGGYETLITFFDLKKSAFKQ